MGSEKNRAARNLLEGTPELDGFSLLEVFSETFRPRTVAEIEECLNVGTARTTPAIAEVSTFWPKPWLFLRCYVLFGLAYLGFVLSYVHFGAVNLAPGLMLMGAAAGPISTLIFFFELNTPRNVSLYRLVVLVALGGVVALLISFVGYDMANLGWLSAAGAGVIEELGKVGAVILLTRGWPHRYILNGMLFGAAVGAGFAAFESAGYAYQINLDSGSSNAMMANLVERGFLAPLMHVTWTAMVSAALWRARTGAGKSLTARSLKDWRLYGVLGLAMSLHTVWNVAGDGLILLKAAALGGAAWFVTLGLAQQGLQQIRDEQGKVLPSVEKVAT